MFACLILVQFRLSFESSGTTTVNVVELLHLKIGLGFKSSRRTTFNVVELLHLKVVETTTLGGC